MKWLEVTVHTTNAAVEPIVNIFREGGIDGVVIVNSLDLLKKRKTELGEIYALNPDDYPQDGVDVKAYIPDDDRQQDTIETVEQSVQTLYQYDIDIGNYQLFVNRVDEEDWSTAWKKYYKPVQVSKRITIAPTWENYVSKSKDELIIELDPGMAFGTGTHATTKLSLYGLEQYLKPYNLVVDVGCGSGVLSIASIKLGAKQVLAYDLDQVAVHSTLRNAKLNQVDSKLVVKQNNLLQDVHLKADIIVANILAEVIVRFVSDAWDNLQDGGFFITSGIIKKREDQVRQGLLAQGFSIIECKELKGWVSIVAQKSMKR